MTQQIRQLMLMAEEKQALQAHYQETNNRRWQERIQCVLLKAQGLTLEAISEVIPYNINYVEYEFKDAKQAEITYRDTALTEGSAFEIVYLPDNPEISNPKSEAQRADQILYFAAGGLMIIISGKLLLKNLKMLISSRYRWLISSILNIRLSVA